MEMVAISVPSSFIPNTGCSLFGFKCNLSHSVGYGGGSMAAQMRNAVSPLLQIRSRFVPQRRGNPGFFFSLKAGVGDSFPSDGVPKSVPVGLAHELLQSGHRYLDVRTAEEFSAGHVPGATNIPYMFKVGSGMTKNTKFLEDISAHFGKDDQIVVGCLSGKRSFMAACDLQAAGYTNITDIAGGYAAWAQNGLPIES